MTQTPDEHPLSLQSSVLSPHPVLLGIFPHPDDEAYSAGGALALAARDGVDVYILCATRGEGGKSADPALSTPAAIAAARSAELTESCRLLGARPPLFLDYPDGGLADVDLPEAVGRIVRVIRAVRPRVVLTLGADGVYGHPDHVALHKIVMPAFRSAGGGTRFPDEVYGPSHQPARLLWTAYPRGLFRPQWEQMLRSEHAAAVRQIDPEKLGVDPAEFAVTVDISAVAQTKLAAIGSHRTQLPDGDPRGIFPAGIVPLLLGVEYYQFGAGSRLPPGAMDLFAGL